MGTSSSSFSSSVRAGAAVCHNSSFYFLPAPHSTMEEGRPRALLWTWQWGGEGPPPRGVDGGKMRRRKDDYISEGEMKLRGSQEEEEPLHSSSFPPTSGKWSLLPAIIITAAILRLRFSSPPPLQVAGMGELTSFSDPPPIFFQSPSQGFLHRCGGPVVEEKFCGRRRNGLFGHFAQPSLLVQEMHFRFTHQSRGRKSVGWGREGKSFWFHRGRPPIGFCCSDKVWPESMLARSRGETAP